MKEIQAYLTSDHKLFQKKSEAEKHETFLTNRKIIENFLDSADNVYTSIPQRAIARNSIISWETWKNKNA